MGVYLKSIILLKICHFESRLFGMNRRIKSHASGIWIFPFDSCGGESSK